MFLIDEPFVSDFLIKTIKENNFKIIATNEAKNLINDDSLNWINEKKAVEELLNKAEIPLYTNSENAIAWISRNLQNTNLPHAINLFKDKFKFRELIKDLYPGFFYQNISPQAIQNYTPDKNRYPFVIKPSVGFFSLGVYIVHNNEDWKKVQEELKHTALHNIYPPEVLNTADFIIEEFIEGEEFAIDSYFDDKGNIVILNILHHRFSSSNDTGDRVYSTSKNIVLDNIDNIEGFLQKIGAKAGLKNFPLHTEVRIDKAGKIHPIEVNPLRFGGWCTTGDLSYFAFGFNSYEYYTKKKKPDWEKIFKQKKDKIYSIIVLNNNSGIAETDISGFDYNLLKKDFENALLIRKTDYKKYKVFGFVFVETSSNNQKELTEILNSDLRKYIQNN
ncbi:MAG: ATP-grasp domain-containing protein [Bacteroidales bacterium]|nr:ATP-grasp domain-containing protein [Bacteroidales bacterium]